MQVTKAVNERPTPKVWPPENGNSLKARSEQLGVGSAYIISNLQDEAFEAAREAAKMQDEEARQSGQAPEYPIDPSNPNFLDISGVFCKGDKGKGYGLRCVSHEQHPTLHL